PAEDGIRDLTVTGVQTCALPIYDPARSGAGAHNILAGVRQQLSDLLRLRIVAEQRHGAFAIRKEVDLVADPHGVDVVGIGAWNRSEERRVGTEGRWRRGADRWME